MRSGREGLKRAVLVVSLGALTWVGTLPLQTPPVVPRTAGPDVFSAERAQDHLEAIGTRSRAVGTPGHASARAYLVAAARSLGLEVDTPTTPAHVRFSGSPVFSASTTRNVVVRLRGTSSTGAIAVNTHYDSGSTGPGTSDCGSCVATGLEAMRAVSSWPRMRNDVLFVFTDAEEEGDIGAAAFAGRHPWAADVKVALNYEAQGTSGPAFLYATSRRSGWLVSEFLHAAPHATAYSWMTAIMGLYPAGQLACDLEEYTKRGVQGLGFVYAGDSQNYHTVRDNLEQIDMGSVQQEGDYTVALLRELGDMDLTRPPHTPDRVFFNVVPGGVASYREAWVLPLAVVVSLAILGLLAFGSSRRHLSLSHSIKAGLALAAGSVAIVSVTVLLWLALRTADPGLRVTLVGRYASGLYTGGLVAVQLALVIGLARTARSRFGESDLVAGALVAWLPLLWISSVLTPAMSYMATWPLALATMALAWHLLAPPGHKGSWLHVGILTLAGSATLVLLPSTVHQASALLNRFEGAAGLPVFGLLSLFVAPALLLLVAQILFVSEGRWAGPLTRPSTVAVVGLGMLAAATVGSSFSPDRPRPDHVSYVLDADVQEARWVSFDRDLDHWTSQFIGEEDRREYPTVAWGAMEAYSAVAPLVPRAAPEAIIDDASEGGGIRTLRLRILSPRPRLAPSRPDRDG